VRALQISGNPIFLKPCNVAQFPDGWIQALVIGKGEFVGTQVAFKRAECMASKVLKSL
jgi:hypothetical protein